MNIKFINNKKKLTNEEVQRRLQLLIDSNIDRIFRYERKGQGAIPYGASIW